MWRLRSATRAVLIANGALKCTFTTRAAYRPVVIIVIIGLLAGAMRLRLQVGEHVSVLHLILPRLLPCFRHADDAWGTVIAGKRRQAGRAPRRQM